MRPARQHSFGRHERIASVLQRELIQVIQRQMRDPRLTGMLTLSEVVLSKDLRHATVYFTVLAEDQAKAPEWARVLNRAGPFLRTALSELVLLRAVPQLHFIYDDSVVRAHHLNRLMNDQ